MVRDWLRRHTIDLMVVGTVTLFAATGILPSRSNSSATSDNPLQPDYDILYRTAERVAMTRAERNEMGVKEGDSPTTIQLSNYIRNYWPSSSQPSTSRPY